MAPNPPRSLLLLAAVLAAVCIAPAARAESQDPQTLAFGWLVEHSDAVVVARPTADRPASEGLHEVTLQIEESIQGPLEPQATASLLVRDQGEGGNYEMGRSHLAFLRALPAEEDQPVRWVLLGGAFGIRPVPTTGPEALFPGICREIAEAWNDADAYRALLVTWIQDDDAGIAWSAATDLVRHAEMHDALTDSERSAIVAAFERQPIGKSTKKALAHAAAITRDPSAATALVTALLHPRAQEIRIDVADALRRLESPDAVALLVQALQRAQPQQASNLLNALGLLAPDSIAAAEAARLRVPDPIVTVRIEAAHALGRIAREIYRANPGQRVNGRTDLLATLAKAETDNEQRTMVWALAQFDEPAAYEALKTLAADDERKLVRQAAERYLANPRLSLLLTQ